MSRKAALLTAMVLAISLLVLPVSAEETPTPSAEQPVSSSPSVSSGSGSGEVVEAGDASKLVDEKLQAMNESMKAMSDKMKEWMDEQVKAIQVTIDQFKADLDDMTKKMSDEFKVIDENRKGLEERLNSSIVDVKPLEDKIATLEQQMKEILALNDTIKALTDRAKSIEEKLEQNEKDMSAIDMEIEGIKKNLQGALEAVKAPITEDVAKLKSEMEASKQKAEEIFKGLEGKKYLEEDKLEAAKSELEKKIESDTGDARVTASLFALLALLAAGFAIYQTRCIKSQSPSTGASLLQDMNKMRQEIESLKNKLEKHSEHMEPTRTIVNIEKRTPEEKIDEPEINPSYTEPEEEAKPIDEPPSNRMCQEETQEHFLESPETSVATSSDDTPVEEPPSPDAEQHPDPHYRQ